MTETIAFELSARQREILTHTLGAGREVPKKSHGYRNRYCAGIGSPCHQEILALVEAGLMEPGMKINGDSDQMFGATVKGCQAIGLGKAAIKRAFED